MKNKPIILVLLIAIVFFFCQRNNDKSILYAIDISHGYGLYPVFKGDVDLISNKFGQKYTYQSNLSRKAFNSNDLFLSDSSSVIVFNDTGLVKRIQKPTDCCGWQRNLWLNANNEIVACEEQLKFINIYEKNVELKGQTDHSLGYFIRSEDLNGRWLTLFSNLKSPKSILDTLEYKRQPSIFEGSDYIYILDYVNNEIQYKCYKKNGQVILIKEGKIISEGKVKHPFLLVDFHPDSGIAALIEAYDPPSGSKSNLWIYNVKKSEYKCLGRYYKKGVPIKTYMFLPKNVVSILANRIRSNRSK